MWRYIMAWPGLAILGIANGSLRVLTYGKLMPELLAHQVSTVVGIFLVGLTVVLLHRRWPISSYQQAVAIGVLWVGMTALFEFGFGHYVIGHNWERLLHDYNLAQGRVWSLFLLWLGLAPAWVHHRRTRAAG